jgi:hypothetical protein
VLGTALLAVGADGAGQTGRPDPLAVLCVTVGALCVGCGAVSLLSWGLPVLARSVRRRLGRAAKHTAYGTLAHWWRESKAAVVYALLAAVAIEPVWHVLTYVLHDLGLVWPWELYFPLH